MPRTAATQPSAPDHAVPRESRPGFDVLRAYLRARASFTDAELDFVETMFTPASLRAGEFLKRGGSAASRAAFVARGCLRSYVIDEAGREHIIKFAPETWWVEDSASLTSGMPSNLFIDAVEDSDILLQDFASHETLVARVPAYAEAFRKGLQKHAAAKDKRIVSSISASAQERYLQFLETYPSLATRVPQFMLASYVGVSPETISRIRRKLARK